MTRESIACATFPPQCRLFPGVHCGLFHSLRHAYMQAAWGREERSWYPRYTPHSRGHWGAGWGAEVGGGPEYMMIEECKKDEDG